MKKKQNPQRLNRKLFKRFFFILFLLLSISANAADLLERAASLERDGKSEDARNLYLQWLSKAESSESESFGRILIHTLRMPAPLEEDLNLIEKHINRIASAQDKKDILRTAVILSELSGNNELTQHYLALLGSLERAPAGTAADITISRLTMSSDIKYEYIAALKENTDSHNLLQWIDRVHRQYPSLITEPDWLYQLQNVLIKAGYQDKAEIFKKRILENFPDSVEASLLKKEVSLLAGPDELFDSIEFDDTGFDENTVNAPLQSQNTPGTLYQAGSFKSYENASRLKAELEQAGLVSIIESDSDSYKVIVESKNDVLTREVFSDKGIKAFRIHP